MRENILYNEPPVGSRWHALSTDDSLSMLRSSTDGLTSEEAAHRLSRHGPNFLPAAPPVSNVQRLVRQFNHLLIYVLFGAAGLAALLGHMVDTVVILFVVLVNGVVGYIQEGRAEKALAAIRGLVSPSATVVRDGQRLTIAAADVVPGDTLMLEPGDRVVADVRLLKARNLAIDEAALTGESVPAEKATAPVALAAPLGDRSSMAYSGTLVTAGQGLGLVVATAGETELGRISSLLSNVEEMTTPLVRQMNRFAGQLTVAILVVSILIFGFAVWARNYTIADALMAVVGVAVSAIPEGLPAVMTITLAIGVQRMATRKAVIRKLPAVETLGSVTVICSDKTGTLTRNEMTVRSVVTASRTFSVSGVGYEPTGGFHVGERHLEARAEPILRELTRAVLLCNDSRLRHSDTGWQVDGDPMEGALVALATKAGHEPEALRQRFPRRDEVPFDAAHRFMATLHQGLTQGAVVYVKGAPEQLVSLCERQRSDAGDVPIDRHRWHREIEGLAQEGQRVLAVATKSVDDGTMDLTFTSAQQSLVLLGLVGLIDPPRTESVDAIAECRNAGIQVKMITGDHAATAQAIARQLGLDNPDKAITGLMIDALDEAGLRAAAQTTSVFARTSPEHKLRIVRALQADGAVVAMTGDGVNDAPALKRADVGVAMGQKGTEAAKEAAQMVLLDDNFASIVAAVREGRTVYDNLTKVIAWTLPTSGGEALAIISAILLGLALPITPVQILWINMVTAVALGITLAFEPTEPGAMSRPPRAPGEPLLSRLLAWRVLMVSVLFAIAALGLFAWADRRGLGHETARTMVVNMLVVMEIFYLFSVRYRYTTSLTWQGVLGTPAVLIGTALIVVIQLLFTYAPFMQRWFDTRPLSLHDGLLIIGLGAALFLVLEAEKLVLRRIGTVRGRGSQQAAPGGREVERH
jgi:magnesium-transporting ATPase (P-type)